MTLSFVAWATSTGSEGGRAATLSSFSNLSIGSRNELVRPAMVELNIGN